MHSHLLQEHFLKTFPNEGPGSVNLHLIRKLSLPKRWLAQGRCLKSCRERPGNLTPASMNSTMPPAPSYPASSSQCFSPSLSSFQTPKQKFHPKQPRRTPVKSNNPPTKLQAVLLSQPTPSTLLSQRSLCSFLCPHSGLSLFKTFLKEVSSADSLDWVLTILPIRKFGLVAPAEQLQIHFGYQSLCQKFGKDLREEGL